jgi:hypothetical protein
MFHWSLDAIDSVVWTTHFRNALVSAYLTADFADAMVCLEGEG